MYELASACYNVSYLECTIVLLQCTYILLGVYCGFTEVYYISVEVYCGFNTFKNSISIWVYCGFNMW